MERRPPDPSTAAAELIRCLDALVMMEQRRRPRPIAGAGADGTMKIITRSGGQLIGSPEGQDPRVPPRRDDSFGTDETIVYGTVDDNGQITCQSLSHQYREYQSTVNKSSALRVTEEAMAAKLPFQRGSDGRRSLPTKIVLNGTTFSPASRTVTHLPVASTSGPGLLFLTFNGRTRKVAKPSSIDSMTVVWSLFSKAFPFISGNALNADQYQVYIHDRVADRFFLLTSLEDVQDGTMLKLVIVKSENTRTGLVSPYFHLSTDTPAVHYSGPVISDNPSSHGTTCTSTESRRSRLLKEVETVSRSQESSTEDRSEADSSKSGSSTGSDDSYTRNKVAMLEAQLSQLTQWMRSMLSAESETVRTDSVVHPPRLQHCQSKEFDQLKVNGIPHKSAFVNSNGYRTALKRLMCQARDLKMEVRSLKRVHLAQAESMAEQFIDVKRQILSAVGCIVNGSRARMALVECMRTDNVLFRHKDGVARLEQQLSKIEKCVDELRTNVVTQGASIDVAEIEAYAVQLCEASRSATDVKASLRLVRDDFRRSAITELMHSTEQKRFIEKQPQLQAIMMERIEELTFDLSNLKRCAGSDVNATYAVPVQTCGLPLESKVEQNRVTDTVRSAIKDSIEPSKVQNDFRSCLGHLKASTSASSLDLHDASADLASVQYSTRSSEQQLLKTEFHCTKIIKSEMGHGGPSPSYCIRDREAAVNSRACTPSGAFTHNSLCLSSTEVTTKVEITSNSEVPISSRTDVMENGYEYGQSQSTQDCSNGMDTLEKVGDGAAWPGDATAHGSAALSVRLPEIDFTDHCDATKVKEALTCGQRSGNDHFGLQLDTNDQETSSCLPHTFVSKQCTFPTGCNLSKKNHGEQMADAKLGVSEMPIESGSVIDDATQAHTSCTFGPRPTVTTRAKPPVAPKPILRLLQLQQNQKLPPGLSEQSCSAPRAAHRPSRAQPLSTAL